MFLFPLSLKDSCKQRPQMSSLSNRIYILLEIEKLRQSHASMPTMFVFPREELRLDGIVYCKAAGCPLRFRVEKRCPEDSWMVLAFSGNGFLDFGHDSLSDTLMQLDMHVQSGMWNGSAEACSETQSTGTVGIPEP